MFCTEWGGLLRPPLPVFRAPFQSSQGYPGTLIFLFTLAIRTRFHYRLTGGIKSATERGIGMKDLIREIVQALVDQPEIVSVFEIVGENTNILEVKVAKSDMGKVIGKQGRNAQALRNILSAASGRSRKKYVLEILE